jgi:hypothetical protein
MTTYMFTPFTWSPGMIGFNLHVVLSWIYYLIWCLLNYLRPVVAQIWTTESQFDISEEMRKEQQPPIYRKAMINGYLWLQYCREQWNVQGHTIVQLL